MTKFVYWAGLAAGSLLFVSVAASAAAGGANNTAGPYDQTTPSGAASGNGKGNGHAWGRPGAGAVGNADNKNPPGQLPDAENDGNDGYECDANMGIAQGNPAHSPCTVTPPPAGTPPPPQ